MAEASKKITTETELQYSDQGHTEVFQDGFHLEQASQVSIKEVESLCCASGAEAGFKKKTHECCSIALESGLKLNSWRATTLQSLAPTSSKSHLLGSF